MHSIIMEEIFSSHFRIGFQICVGGSYTRPNTAEHSSSSSWHAHLPPLSLPALLRRLSPALPTNCTVFYGCHRCPAIVTKPRCDAPLPSSTVHGRCGVPAAASPEHTSHSTQRDRVAPYHQPCPSGCLPPPSRLPTPSGQPAMHSTFFLRPETPENPQLLNPEP
jgi:hypothetical protein